MLPKQLRPSTGLYIISNDATIIKRSNKNYTKVVSLTLVTLLNNPRLFLQWLG